MQLTLLHKHTPIHNVIFVTAKIVAGHTVDVNLILRPLVGLRNFLLLNHCYLIVELVHGCAFGISSVCD